MKSMGLRGVNQKGFIHHILPVFAFVALFAVIGAYFLLRASNAATTNYYLESTAFSAYNCLSINPAYNQSLLDTCGAYWAPTQVTFLGSSSSAMIKLGGKCLQNVSGTAKYAACNTSIGAQHWQLAYPYVKTASLSPALCLGAKTTHAQLAVVSCSDGSYHKTWKQVAIKTSTPTPKPPVPHTVNFSGSGNCTANVYSVQNSASTFKNCSAAIQTMVRAMGAFDGGSKTLAIDGYYGNNTASAVATYQRYQKTSTVQADGIVGPITWKYLCWSMRNHRENNAQNNPTVGGTRLNTSGAYYYAGCASEGNPPGK